MKFKKYNTIKVEERRAVNKVMKSGILSNFFANKNKNFLGGKYVLKFEKECQKYFKVNHAITVNSWTSGLIAIIGSLDVRPGDEIILSPWTMSACSSAILHWGCIPIFADINEKTFNIDPNKIRSKITNKTKAIMGIDLFGQPCDMLELKKICNKHNLKFICDSAQSIGAKYKNNYSSTYADVGGYSLNFHKHINTGEGGIIITNNKKIAHKCRLIRNHAEVTVGKSNSRELVNMIGYNFRLTEIQAAIGIEQLKKLKKIIKKKIEIANYLSKNLSKLPGLEIPYLKKNRTHVYYSYPMKINSEITKTHRDKIWKMLLGEGVPVNNKIPCLHLLPMFQKQIAFGNNNYPWNKNKKYKGIYKSGTLPIAEKLSDNSILCLQMWAYDFTKKDLDKIINIFYKVWKKLELI
tara:strand:+ start:435 stop:1658 length:1224 start_codon:yes stop_codon:yes gene_type:complete